MSSKGEVSGTYGRFPADNLRNRILPALQSQRAPVLHSRNSGDILQFRIFVIKPPTLFQPVSYDG